MTASPTRGAGGARTVSEDWIRAGRGMLFVPSSGSGAHSEQVFTFENVSMRAGDTLIAAREGGCFSCLARVFVSIRGYSWVFVGILKGIRWYSIQP